jgi:hypothetical protein
LSIAQNSTTFDAFGTGILACEETIRIDGGKAKFFVIQDEGIPYDGKVNFKWLPSVNIQAIFAGHGR